MRKYFFGFFKNFLKKGVSFIAFVDNTSNIDVKARINRLVKVYDSNIGAFTYVGSKTEIICADIGKFCSIAHRSSIGLGTHSISTISTSPIFTSENNGTGYSWTKENQFLESKRVTIGNDVWIGIECIIMGGITIGNGAIIGAGSIVTKDVPDYAIVVGVPAKIQRFRFEPNIINKLLQLEWWNMPEAKIKSKINLFQKQPLQMEDLEELIK